MSWPIQYECHICFGLTGTAGRTMGEKHRCKCEDEAEAVEPVPYSRIGLDVDPQTGNSRIAA